jgi:hypothetical protein
VVLLETGNYRLIQSNWCYVPEIQVYVAGIFNRYGVISNRGWWLVGSSLGACRRPTDPGLFWNLPLRRFAGSDSPISTRSADVRLKSGFGRCRQ